MEISASDLIKLLKEQMKIEGHDFQIFYQKPDYQLVSIKNVETIDNKIILY